MSPYAHSSWVKEEPRITINARFVDTKAFLLRLPEQAAMLLAAKSAMRSRGFAVVVMNSKIELNEDDLNEYGI